MNICPHCKETVNQVKASFTEVGSQRYKCNFCIGDHLAMGDKSETYAVEAGNAELRHYLARLVRRSRCFSRCINALRRHGKAFVHAWNRRQLHKQQYPKYPTHLIDFVYP